VRKRSNCVLILVLLLGCSANIPDYSTPQYALRTYVYAYNHGNGVMLRKCGMATQLNNAFTKSKFDENDEETLIPVENIVFKVKDIEEGDMSVTKFTTVRRVWLDVEFTSETDPEFYLRKKILFEEQRLQYESKTMWHIL
jgi:hypothetical protein